MKKTVQLFDCQDMPGGGRTVFDLPKGYEDEDNLCSKYLRIEGANNDSTCQWRYLGVVFDDPEDEPCTPDIWHWKEDVMTSIARINAWLLKNGADAKSDIYIKHWW